MLIQRSIIAIAVFAAPSSVWSQTTKNTSFHVRKMHCSEVKPGEVTIKENRITRYVKTNPGFTFHYDIEGENLTTLESIDIESIIDPAGKNITFDKNGQPTYSIWSIYGNHAITEDKTHSHFGLFIENGIFDKSSEYKVRGKVKVTVSKAKSKETNEVAVNDKNEMKIGPFSVWAVHPIPQKTFPFGNSGGVMVFKKIPEGAEGSNSKPVPAWGSLMVRGPANQQLEAIRCNDLEMQDYDCDWFGRTYTFGKPPKEKVKVSISYWTDSKTRVIPFE